MVNELRVLLRESVSDAPPDLLSPTDLVHAGRSRVRRRRAGQLVAATVAVGLVATGAALVGPGLGGDRTAPTERPDLVGPVLHLADAVPATGVDVVARHTEENLNRANGASFSGVTDDGLVLVADGPHGIENRLDLTLLDPVTGDEQQLPSPPGPDWGQVLELSEERIVVSTYGMMTADTLGAYVLDRETLEWSEVLWSGLPAREWRGTALGPDGRVYVGVAMSADEQRQADLEAAREAAGEGEEVDDAGITGARYALWSVSPTDPADARDEDLVVGSFAFDDDTMAWTARTNGTNDRVSVRDLESGEVTSFDPLSGARCNVLGFGLAGEHVVLSQYCGESGGERDDRVQVVTTDGDPVVTVQGSGLDGGAVDDRWVEVRALDNDRATTDGTYVYDLETGDLLRLSDSVSSFSIGGGPMPPGYVMWSEAVNDRRGQQQVIARLD
jgi:hypothetical protein